MEIKWCQNFNWQKNIDYNQSAITIAINNSRYAKT
jgi:hypothetical protein